MPNIPKIDEVSKTPMNGLYEVRMGSDIMYSDAEGNFLIQGNLFDVRQKRNLTEERVNKLIAVKFDDRVSHFYFFHVRNLKLGDELNKGANITNYVE
mgnify:CR=1 FL=1